MNVIVQTEYGDILYKTSFTEKTPDEELEAIQNEVSKFLESPLLKFEILFEGDSLLKDIESVVKGYDIEKMKTQIYTIK